MENEKSGKLKKYRISLLDILKRILIFAVLVVVTTILLRPLQLGLQSRVGKIRDNFLNQVEEYWGLKLRYGSMGPSIFGVLDLRNVFVLRQDDSVLLSVSRLRLSYSVLMFLRGNPVQAFHSVRIDRPVLNLDFDKDNYLFNQITLFGRQRAPPANGTDRESPSIRDFIPEDFTFRILNGEWEVSGAAGSFKLQGLRLDAAVRKDRLSFQGRWEALASLNSLQSMLSASMRGRINGEYFADLDEGSATIQIPSLTGNNFIFRPLSIGFFLSQGHLEIRKTYDRMPVAISVFYDAEDGVLSGSLEAENFSPSELITFTGSWNEYNSWLGTRISGSAGFNRDEAGALGYFVEAKTAVGETNVITMRVKAAGDKSHVVVDFLELGSPFGGMDFHGDIKFLPGEFIPVAPTGHLALSSFNLHGSHGISGNIAINTQDRMINLFGENVSAGKTELSVLDASIYQDEQGLSFIFTAIKSPDYEGEDNRILSMEGSIDYNSDLGRTDHVRASLLLDSFLVGDILAFVEPLAPSAILPPLLKGTANNISISTEVFFTTDFEYLLYNAPNITVTYDGLANVKAAASLSGTNRSFELSEGHIYWENGQVDISCLVDYSDPKDINFSLNAAYKEQSYFFEGIILDQLNLSVRGSYGFLVNLSTGNNNRFSGYILGDMIPIPSGDKFAYLSFYSTLYYDSPSSWQVEIERMEMTGITISSSNSTSVRFTGSASENGLVIPDILIDGTMGILEGGINLDWDPGYSYIGFTADLIGRYRNEYYGISGSYQNEKLDLSFSGLGMQLSRLSRYNAVADLNLNLSWTSTSSFKVEADLPSLIFYMQEKAIRASGSFIADSEMLIINQLSANYSGMEITVPLFYIDRLNSRSVAQAIVQGSVSGQPLALSLRGETFFNKSETWVDLFGGYGFIDGLLSVKTAIYNGMYADEPFNFTVNAVRERRGIFVNASGGPKNMLRLDSRPGPEGENLFFAALSAPSPVRGSFTGVINKGNIDAQIGDLYVDLGALWRFMPPSVDAVLFPGGIVTGSGPIRVTGPLDDPEFFGIAHAKSVQIHVPQFITEPIRPVPAVFQLTGSEMTFGPIDAAVGRGGGIATGWFRFDQWVPATFIIDIQVPHETPIPYGFDLSGLISHGLASGNMVIAMEEWVLSVTGDLVAHNTEISLNALEFAAFSGERLSDREKTVTVVTNIAIRSGRRVEFYWPSADFPILQANADMGTGIRVSSDEGSGHFAVKGDVKLRSGEIFYLERNFYLREGVLFFDENEHSFNPHISARAEMRDQAEEGPVIIAMIIDNAPLMSFTPRFESNPPLSQLEIFSLLGQNPQGEFDSGQRNVFITGIDFLAQSLLLRRFQRQVRDLLGLDMFSMRTTIFQNLILQTPGNQSQENTERPTRFGNYFDNSTVFIGKFFGADIFGEALFSFRYDENKQTMGGMKLEPEIGLEMRNPLFDIRFNVAALNTENWFMPEDISFSFIWRRTY